MKKLFFHLKNILRLHRVPKIINEDRKTNYFKTNMAWPIGHFYSPLPSIDEIKKEEQKIFIIPGVIPGVNLNKEEQFEIFNELKRFYPEVPFSDTKQEGLRYYYSNPNFSYGEAIILFCMIRYLRPKRIIEIGAGYSSCAMVDINEMFFNNEIELTFIEPYPELLLSLLKKNSKENYKIIDKNVQDINNNVFENLNRNDILFIDSSHVSKINSDVNNIFFEILPVLNTGVYIHFHDIYYAFEYPKEWIYRGIAWNEVYMLRSFLMFNNSFKIKFYNSYLSTFHKDIFSKDMPMFLKNPGSSIWIKKDH